MIITIDGPSGTGKSTVAKEVASRLGFTFFETGATYRSLSWLALKEGVDPADEKAVVALLPRFQYEIRLSHEGDRRYFVNGHDVTGQIRTQAISMAASQVATYAAVRHTMVAIQRKYGEASDAVFEGRDMGTVVFPQADLKIFLTATPEVRTERRYRELCQKFPDLSMSKEELLKETIARDHADSTRAISPLKRADDAILIDTSHLNAHQVVEKILKLKPKPKYPKMGLFYQAIYLLMKGYFRLFFRLRVYGLERYRSGGAIIAANHTSFFDPPVLAISCPEEVHFLARANLFDVPILGRLIRLLNAHPVSNPQAIRLAQDLLAEEKKIILFPEGKRSDGDLLPLEKGLAFLAQKSRCRIIPAYIDGTQNAWPSHKRFPKFFGKITVVFGSPIEWDGDLDKKEAQEKITARTEAAIRSLKVWLERVR